MSQELRLRLASRSRLATSVRDEVDVPVALRVRRFSEGLERRPHGRIFHVGRFSDGVERLPDDASDKAHVGRFSDGLEHEHDPLLDLRVGRFSDGVEA